jgi:hypothetical protein
MSYLARARAIHVEWDEAIATAAIDAALERIGRTCRDIPAGIVLADAEERVNVAAQHRDRDAFAAALIAYERVCLTPLTAEPHHQPNRPVTSQEKKP